MRRTILTLPLFVLIIFAVVAAKPQGKYLALHDKESYTFSAFLKTTDVSVDKKGGMVHLFWRGVGATRYEIWRGTPLIAPYDKAARIATLKRTTLEYYDNVLNDGKDYYYYVVAK